MIFMGKILLHCVKNITLSFYWFKIGMCDEGLIKFYLTTFNALPQW